MRKAPHQKAEKYRVKKGPMSSNRGFGNNGVFLVHAKTATLHVTASDGGGWDHVSVSVSLKSRTPSWAEMCFVKSLFWRPEETVVQYHPAEAEYINQHPFVLHLWKPQGQNIPMPPLEFV